MKNILVLCTGNSCRSQMAEGYLRYFAGNKATVYSAGVIKTMVNPIAEQVMMDDGIDISEHTSNHVEEYLHIPFDYIITVCDHAKETCPVIPGNGQRFHLNFFDPSHVQGTDEERLFLFRRTRDEIKAYCQQWVNDNLQ